MRGLPYYEEESYHEYLLSPERKEIYPPDLILKQINLEGVENILDFGMGNGYFIPYLYKYLPENTSIWGAECQEVLIDRTLKSKVNEKWSNFIPFYIERTEHPLLPDWIPRMDRILCSCVLSTFADPHLAIKGIGRTLNPDGQIIILDWEKEEAPSGPSRDQKVSRDRMRYFIEEAGYEIMNQLEINEFFYGLICSPGEKAHEDDPGFQYLHY